MTICTTVEVRGSRLPNLYDFGVGSKLVFFPLFVQNLIDGGIDPTPHPYGYEDGHYLGSLV